MKKEYSPPLLETVTIRFEAGFAASGDEVQLSEWTDYGEEEL